jgi:cellulose synthase/poly-beta-1,6-N-acetylglucosamine synthase-like glycosyltransferase
MPVFLIISLVLLLGYFLLILIYAIGWWLIKVRVDPKLPSQHTFTVMIPARNEAHAIEACLKSIIQQGYPKEKFEIIVIDDHSEDDTAQIVQQCIEAHPDYAISLLPLAKLAPKGNKKEGITLGVSYAKAPHFILTDADCVRGKEWLSAIDSFMQKHPAKMIYAPVFFSASNTFERLQSLEFLGLVGIGAAAIQLKNPNMCSAANLIVNKQAFLEVGGYQDNIHLASGDDEFLLHKIFKKYPHEVWFLKDRRAIVETSPNASLNQLAQQRTRWVSKSTKYEDRYITAILVAAYLFNFSILFNLIYGCWQPLYLKVGLVQAAIKTAVEGIFLYEVSRFFNKRYLIWYLPLAEPFHMLYVIIIGIWANVKPYTWKNRTHHS